jgi:hypothetical protein
MFFFELLDVLFRGLEASPVAWIRFVRHRDKHIAICLKNVFFIQLKIITISIIKSLDLIPESDPDPRLNQCGSITLIRAVRVGRRATAVY